MPKCEKGRTERQLPSPIKPARGSNRSVEPRIKDEPADDQTVPLYRIQGLRQSPQKAKVKVEPDHSVEDRLGTDEDDHPPVIIRQQVQENDVSQGKQEPQDLGTIKNEHESEDRKLGKLSDQGLGNEIVGRERSSGFLNVGPSINMGINFVGNSWCRHALKTDSPTEYVNLRWWPHGGDGRPYHYVNSLSIFYYNADHSTYTYNRRTHRSTYTSPTLNGLEIIENYNPNVKAEIAMYCFDCNKLGETGE